MPRLKTKIVLQIGEFTPKVFGIIGLRLSRLVGRAKDLQARLGRWTAKIPDFNINANSENLPAGPLADDATSFPFGEYDRQDLNAELWEKGPKDDLDYKTAATTRAAIVREARTLCSPLLSRELGSQSPYISQDVVTKVVEEAQK